MARHKDQNWSLPDGYKQSDGSRTHSWESIQVSLLMDLRDELKSLNRLLHCSNFIAIPRKLDRIGRNTEKKRRKK